MKNITVRAIWEFEVDMENFDEEFVDIEGLAKELTQKEMRYLLQNQKITDDVFSYELEAKNKSFTKDELQLMYAALMAYGNKLSDMAKEVPNESIIQDGLSNQAKETWNLARKVIK